MPIARARGLRPGLVCVRACVRGSDSQMLRGADARMLTGIPAY